MSSEELLAKVKENYENAYRKRTPKSRAMIEIARKYMPGGETRSSHFFRPYPIWTEKANGCRITDIDSNEYIDFNNSFTAMVLGHGNPMIKAAVRKQIEEGTGLGSLGTPAPSSVRWAELLCQRVDSFDKVRFSNSGTEAVMLAIRAARGFTGRDKILKTEGCYHGCCDVAAYPSESPGLPKSVLADSITVPFNDKEAVARAINENKGQLAAMILETMMGHAGHVPPKGDYLNFVREITAANNVLLILDEVQTFRIDYGGMQRIFGIKPDLTCLGKMVGGGAPVGVTGGRGDIMEQFSAEAQKLRHAGTFNGNPVTATAGIAVLEQLTAKEIARINKLGESLAEGIRRVFTKLNIKGQVTGWGSLQNIHFSQVPVVDGKTSREANKDILPLLHLALLVRGIFLASRCNFIISTPMTEREIDTAVEAVDDSLTELHPHIEQIWPELIGKMLST